MKKLCLSGGGGGGRRRRRGGGRGGGGGGLKTKGDKGTIRTPSYLRQFVPAVVGGCEEEDGGARVWVEGRVEGMGGGDGCGGVIGEGWR